MNDVLVTICEITDNPAREIAEGRGPKRYLNCIPVQTRAALPAKAVWPTDCLIPGPATPQKTQQKPKLTGQGPKMKEVMVRFRATRPEAFTLEQVAAFAASIGYAGNWPTASANQLLKRMLLTGAVAIVDPARGRLPGTWQFTTAN